MCGIAGISMSENDKLMNTQEASAGLLRGIASRGPDATGASWFDPKGDEVLLTKLAVPTWRFLEARREHLPAATPTMILHTRMATHGGTSDRRNNHPIAHGNIVGVHNGVLSNDDELFKQLGAERHGKVDSEAIMALLNQKDAVPTEVLGDIRGDAAVAWIDLREPEALHLARVTGRPLYVAQLKSGSLLFASTKAAVEQGIETLPGKPEVDFEMEMKDEHYMKVVGGVIKSYEAIQNVVSLGSSFTNQYAWTSGNATKPASKTAGKAPALPAKAPEPMWKDEDLDSRAPRTGAAESYIRTRTDEELERMVKGGSRWAKEELDARKAAKLPVFSD